MGNLQNIFSGYCHGKLKDGVRFTFGFAVLFFYFGFHLQLMV